MKWPKPAEVLARWSVHGVPDVEVRPFDPTAVELPWIEKSSGSPYDLGPAAQSTARILCTWYQTAPQEERDAYRVFAYLLSRNRPDFAFEMFGAFFERCSRPARSFYSGRAQHVLPASDAPVMPFPVPSDPRQQARMWPEVVDAAAAAWSMVAAEWAAVRIPYFLPEYVAPSVVPERLPLGTRQAL